MTQEGMDRPGAGGASVMEAMALIEAVGAELAAAPFQFQTQARPLERIPVPDEAEAERRSGLARDWLAGAARIDRAALPAPLAAGVDLAVATAERLAKEAPWFWHVQDLSGLGFFSLFGPTAYGGGWYLTSIIRVLGRHRFATPGDGERYLGLVADVAALVWTMAARLEGQAKRGIVMPKPQLAQARTLVATLAGGIGAQLTPAMDHYTALGDHPAFAARLQRLIEGELAAAFAALGAVLEGPYSYGAGDTVGLGAYPGGAEIYAGLVRHHTTMDLGPQEVHTAGHLRIARIRTEMAELRAEVGFAGDDAAYRQAVAADPAWRASDGEGVRAAFDRCLALAEPRLKAWLHAPPSSPCGAAPLPEALQGAMTFGFYQAPSSPQDAGLYLFNAKNLGASALNQVATLTYHELIPGHHVHLSMQAQAAAPALNRHNSFNAFNEGWAEYAATLAGEEGLYATPEERFGRMTMNAFLTCRLVVDTGMNALGWTLDQGRAYLRENAFMAEREIAAESIRYSCDMPGQSLAYKLGDTFLLEQRERMRIALGPRFDIRDFHDAVLRHGAVPLPMVAAEVGRCIARLAA